MWARQSKFHAIEGPNARDQIAFYACDCHSFLVKAIRMPSTYLPLMHNSKLDIWIAGSSGRPQLAYTSYKVTLLLISLWFSVTPLRKVYNFGKRVGRISVEFPKNFTCPSGKQRTKFPSQTSKIHQLRTSLDNIFSFGALLLINFVAVAARLRREIVFFCALWRT